MGSNPRGGVNNKKFFCKPIGVLCTILLLEQHPPPFLLTFPFSTIKFPAKIFEQLFKGAGEGTLIPPLTEE